MSAPSASRILRQAASRTTTRSLTRQYQTKRQLSAIAQPLAARTSIRTAVLRCFSTSTYRAAGMMPDSEDPQPPNPEPEAHQTTVPTEVSEDEYHEHADRYMNTLNERAEALQESREDVEVEYSAGVMNLTLPPAGTYVINKQPPNKQIWFSSPVSGPKRFDWVVAGESMHHKEGGGAGDWVYMRDGTSLTDLLRRECGISLDIDGEAEAIKKPSVDLAE